MRWLIEDINRAGGPYAFVGYVVSDRSHPGLHDDIDQTVADVDELKSGAFAPDALALGIGNPSARAEIGRAIADSTPGIEWPSLIHPSVEGDFSSWSIGMGTLLCSPERSGTVGIDLRDFTMVNLSCTLGHESKVGSRDFVLTSPSGPRLRWRFDRRSVRSWAREPACLQYVEHWQTIRPSERARWSQEPSNRDTTVVGVPARPVGEHA